MKSKFRQSATFLLILLFIYAAVSKLMTFSDFRYQLLNQTFPHWLAGILLYLLPLSELVAAGLLCSRKTILAGLYVSLGLLSAFTIYISLVMLHYWNRVPCSCGGILSHMSWTAHLAFNWAFILLNLTAIFIYPKERRPPASIPIH